MWDWAPQFRAGLLFTEHRYYGKSLPYGNKSHEMPYLRHLSVDQVMAGKPLNPFKTGRNESIDRLCCHNRLAQAQCYRRGCESCYRLRWFLRCHASGLDESQVSSYHYRVSLGNTDLRCSPNGQYPFQGLGCIGTHSSATRRNCAVFVFCFDRYSHLCCVGSRLR